MILFYKKIPVNTSTISKFKRKVPPGRKRHGTVAHARGRDGHIGFLSRSPAAEKPSDSQRCPDGFSAYFPLIKYDNTNHRHNSAKQLLPFKSGFFHTEQSKQFDSVRHDDLGYNDDKRRLRRPQ